MTTTHNIRPLKAVIRLTVSLLRRLYFTARAMIALAIWRRRLLRSLQRRRRE